MQSPYDRAARPYDRGLPVLLGPQSKQNHGPKPSNRAQKATVLHASGVQGNGQGKYQFCAWSLLDIVVEATRHVLSLMVILCSAIGMEYVWRHFRVRPPDFAECDLLLADRTRTHKPHIEEGIRA